MEYFPIFALFLFAAAIAGGIIILDLLLGPRRPNPIKSSVYECGVADEKIRDMHTRFHIRYYLVALLFLLFDLETVLLYPLAVNFRAGGFAAFFEILLFTGILTIGLIYVWRKGGLEWE